MSALYRRAAGLALAASLLTGPLTAAVNACAVCTGDPTSPMAQGAAAGVLALVAIVGCVLAGIVGVTGFWFVRARRLARGEAALADQSKTGRDEGAAAR